MPATKPRRKASPVRWTQSATSVRLGQSGKGSNAIMYARCDECHATIAMARSLMRDTDGPAREIHDAWVYDHEHGSCAKG